MSETRNVPQVIEETHLNANEGERYLLGESVAQRIEDTIFEGKSTGDIYRWCVREFGRCTGKVYVDTDDGPIAVGWIFLKREQYSDAPDETYLHETWITLYDRHEDEVIRHRDFHAIRRGL